MTFEDRKKNYKSLIFLSIIVLLLLILSTIAFGAANITLGDSLNIILSKIPILKRFSNIQNVSSAHAAILLNIRLPRILLSCIVGMGLSIVGAVYQGIFNNPMADPYVLGISSGAALGAAIAIVFHVESMFLGISGVAFSAFLFSILTTLIVYNIARVGNKAPTVNLLLAGVAVSFFLSSLISIIMILNRNELDKIVFWTMGSLSAANWKQVAFLFVVTVPLFLVMLFFSRDINIILLGDDSAKSLGINVELVKKIMLLISSVLIASIVSVSGIIGFVGLIIPHIVKLLIGSDHRVLIPFSAIIGACFMLLSDTIARTLLAPTEIPVGAITSLFGAPYFIYLLYKTKKRVL